jgi:uncharacterized protein YcbK (DUF882 family)
LSLIDSDQSLLNRNISRRDLLALGLVTAASSIFSTKAFALSEAISSQKELFFYNVYTHENLKAVYWKDGMYLPDGLASINHIFRDMHTGREREININLLDLLFEVKEQLKSKEPFHMISGYRTPKSNAMLSKRKKGVAKNSLHMYGKAVDISIPGYSLRGIRKAAMKLRAGGVGYYPQSKFLHLDVGEVRYWWG